MMGPPALDIVLVIGGLLDFFQPETLVNTFVAGLSKAALYMLIASGLSLIFGLMKVLNFAHGSLTMIGAYLGGAVMVFGVSNSTGPLGRLGVFVAGLAVVFLLMVAIGVLIEMKLIRPLYGRSPLQQILLTFGLVFILDELMRIVLGIYGMDPQITWQAALGTKPGFLRTPVNLWYLNVQGLLLFEILVGFTITGLVWAFLTRTRFGLYIRSGSEDEEMAEAVGINVSRVFTIVFGLGVGLAGIAGMMLMWDPRWGATVPLGIETLLPAFVIVIIGGLGTFRGTVVAALIVGLLHATMTWWFHNVIDYAGLPEIMIFLLLIVVLVVRPEGLYGVGEVGDH